MFCSLLPTPSQPNFLSICYLADSELCHHPSVLSTPSNASEILSIYLLEEISLEPLDLLVTGTGTHWYPNCHLGSPFIIFWGCRSFVCCAGFPFPRSCVLLSFVRFPPFDGTAFCRKTSWGRMLGNRNFVTFHVWKMCLFYLLPWWLLGWVWNSRLEILFIQNFEGITPSSSCFQVLVEKSKVALPSVLNMWPIPHHHLFWKFVLGILKFHDDVLAMYLFLSNMLGTQ